MSAPVCPYCGKTSKLVKGREVYPQSVALADKDIYLCKPCNALVGCHPGTITPLGSLANKELRKARMYAHAAFDPRWESGHMKRKDAYGWLTKQMGLRHPRECHIGRFDLEQCRRVVEVCKEDKQVSVMPSKHRTPYNQNRDKNYGKERDPYTGAVHDCRDRD